MAAVTVGTSTNVLTGSSSNATADGSLRRRSLLGSKHLTVPVSIAADGDTYASGITNITRVAWEAGVNSPNDPEYATPYFATEALRQAGTVTFQASGAVEGILHIWVG